MRFFQKGAPLFALLFFACPGRAATNPPWDVSFKFGMTMGTIKRPAVIVAGVEKELRELKYGGAPFALALHFDLSRKLSISPEFHLTTDSANLQIGEVGAYLTASYFLLGGTRRTSHEVGAWEFTHQDPMGFSLAFRTGLSKYSITPKDLEDPSDEIDGTTLETLLGAQYRQDIFDNGALTLEAFMTFSSLPASTERVTTQRMEFLLSLRFFL